MIVIVVVVVIVVMMRMIMVAFHTIIRMGLYAQSEKGLMNGTALSTMADNLT